MRYSGLIYAAIVACWAAVLVPRWIRRNEEVEHAREEDAARGVRVLEREQRAARVGHGAARPGHPAMPTMVHPPGRSHDEQADDDDANAEPVAATEFSLAARRRRRVLTFLLLTLAGTVAGSVAGVLATGWAVAAAVLLVVFLMLARRAAVAEARRRARARRIAQLRAARSTAKESVDGQAALDGDEPAQPRKRVAVFDEPPPAEPVDPHAWEPVPVPLPTYLTKAKAAPPVARKIDLSSPGAWTSGRLNPASSIALPPSRAAAAASAGPSVGAELTEAERAELPEHRRAVGD